MELLIKFLGVLLLAISLMVPSMSAYADKPENANCKLNIDEAHPAGQ